MKKKLLSPKIKSFKKIYAQQQSSILVIRLKRIRKKPERKYKDAVFTRLFNNKAAALQLYNALYHKNLPQSTPIEIMTLDDTLFQKRKNDVAFLVDGHFLIFVEHQSTVNENMPLRMLFYVVQEYEKYFGYTIIGGKQVSNNSLYKQKLIKVPRPEFFILYNGKTNLTDKTKDNKTKIVTEKLMRLSDAFAGTSDSPNSLELCVKLIDVGFKKGHQILYQNLQQEKQSPEHLTLLGEYSYFVSEVNKRREQGKNLEESIKEASEHCIEKGVLREFLLKNETEVIVMLFGVYDEEIEKQVISEEAREEGRREGRREGIKNLIDFALDVGYSNEKIISTLQEKLKITKQQADDYLRRFYDKTL